MPQARSCSSSFHCPGEFIMAATSRYSSYNCLISWDSYDKIPRVRVEYYVNENTFKERLQLYFIKNQRSSLRIRIANLFFKLLTCILYIFRVVTDLNPTFATCYGCKVGNKTEFLWSATRTEEAFQEDPIINWDAILWVNRPTELWAVQLGLALISLTEALLMAYLGYKFEQLAFTWMERQKLGGSYSSHRAQSEKHVVVCSTTLHADTIMDFLNEFYAHPLLQDYYVVLLSPMELDTTMRMILQVPIWAQRVIYIQGSCLKDGDLARARMAEAEACFILAARSYADKTAADEHAILRSWAVKDFAPNIPQYVQIFRPENKLHVKFAEHVVCEDEFKYALLANNCTCPGASTLVTLLLHTSRGQEGQQSAEEWHRLYGKCSGNEIYHIVLGDSRFFGEYEGKSFTYASFHSHRKYGVALVGVRPAELPEFYEDTILLNPGPRHIMKKDDTCYYMSITKEENSAFVVNQNQTQSPDQPPKEATTYTESVTTGGSNPVPSMTALTNAITISDSKSNLKENAMAAFPATTLANTTTTTQSTLGPPTISSTNHLEIPSGNNPNLLSPDILNQRRGSRRPSILPVPDMFTSSSFSISGEDGIDGEDNESDDEIDDDVPWRSPSEKIAIVKGFPPVSPFIGVSPTLCFLLKEKKPLCCLQLAQAFVKDYVITFVRLLLGIDQAPGSGFLTSMKITKDDMWIRTYGRLYQKLCSTTCEIPIGIYRTQDTSSADASHYDEEVVTTTATASSTSASGKPIKGVAEANLRGVTYRPPPATVRKSSSCLSGCTARKGSSYSINMADEARDNHVQQIERAEIANLVRSRMESLNLPSIDYDDVSEKRNHLSYVIINPSCDLKLEEGDIIYLVRPSPFSAQKTFERHNSRRKSNISFCSNINLAAAAAGSRRGSGIGLNTIGGPQPMSDSPNAMGQMRGRSNSLRIDSDILLRRSNSLRQGLPNIGTSGRRKSSLEEIGISHFATLMQATNHSNPIKIALNGSIGLEVTPPEEPLPIIGVPCLSGGINPSTLGGPGSGLGGSTLGASTLGGSSLGLSTAIETNNSASTPNIQMQNEPSQQPQHLHGTIV
uniref:RCK N-terminal domain-containing protein n=1 Tax=Anopheles farauti TaxID=69004 RepID=A0A182QNB1_9DIPT